MVDYFLRAFILFWFYGLTVESSLTTSGDSNFYVYSSNDLILTIKFSFEYLSKLEGTYMVLIFCIILVLLNPTHRLIKFHLISYRSIINIVLMNILMDMK